MSASSYTAVAARAIVSHEPVEGQARWKLEEVTLRALEPNELLVRIVSTGICHTDMVFSTCSSYFLTKLLLFSMGPPEMGGVSRAYKRTAFVFMSQLLKQLPAPELPPKQTTFGYANLMIGPKEAIPYPRVLGHEGESTTFNALSMC